MKKTAIRIGKIFILILLLAVVVGVALSFKQPPSVSRDISWGVSFSSNFAKHLGLDWQETYIAILDELEPPLIRIPLYWSDIEKERGVFNFEDYDFMIEEAQKRDIGITLVAGKRLPRWPECHIPEWAEDLSEQEEVQELKDLTFEIIRRYRNVPELTAWQVENEPFLPFFGECPLPEIDFLDSQLTLVRLLDSEHPIVVTDSGELSIWVPAASRGDIFGTTMYRTVWSETFSPIFGYITYPLPPKFFWLKANLVHFFEGDDKRIIVSELQAEPWATVSLKELSKEEQEKSLSIDDFWENIEYARAVGFPEIYLWGAEWWYYMKTVRDDETFWQAGKEVIQNSPDATY